MRQKNYRSENGLLSLEASIALTFFIFLMLFMYSFFVFFKARNEVAHVLLASANSLSLDTYETGKLQDSGNISGLVYDIYNMNAPDDNGFTSSDRWNEIGKKDVDESAWDGTIYASEDVIPKDADEYGKTATASSLLAETIQERFIAYLGGGDRAEAQRLTEKLHIVNDLDGLDFSHSYVSSGKLHLIVRYTVEFEFNLFGLGQVEMEQSCCSKLWK